MVGSCRPENCRDGKFHPQLFRSECSYTDVAKVHCMFTCAAISTFLTTINSAKKQRSRSVLHGNGINFHH